MKIQYLGTGAAEGIPAMYCDCELCRTARSLKGKELRSRSQALVDDTILIDFPADTYMHEITADFELGKIHTCIVTHNHSDHFYPADLEMRRTFFAYFDDATPLTFYASKPAKLQTQPILNQYRLEKDNRIFIKEVIPYQEFTAEGYQITALKANHDYSCEPVFYIIRKKDRCMLYAHDTGYFPEETWSYLDTNKLYFDFISFDCTLFHGDLRDGHMSFRTVLEVKERLNKVGLVHSETKYVINHFSHNGHTLHEEMVRIAEKEGFIVAYDYLTIEF